MAISGINIDVGGILGGLGKVGGLFKDIRAAITGKEIIDPNKQAEVEKALVEAESILNNAQTEINKIEAQHPSKFVAGWRPAVGWVCAISLACYYIPRFVLGTTLWVWACIQASALVPAPELGIAEILGLVMSLLGMGTLRTYERKKRIERNSL